MNYRLLRFPEWKAKAVTLSYDDGAVHDRRLLETVNRYGIKCTFNLNSKRFLAGEAFNVRDAESAIDCGHEIAVHGAEHLAPCLVSPSAALRDALNCREELENALGVIIRGMAYPDSGIRRFCNGSNYGEVRAYLRALGIVYARSLGEDNDRFLLPEDWFNWMPTAYHFNKDLFAYIDKFLSLDLDKGWPSGRDPRLFYLWGHAYEFDTNNNWELLEKICKALGGHDDIWYATNIEIHDYIEAFRALHVSCDGRRLFNPTVRTLYFCENNKNYKIEPGEALVVD